MKHVAPDDTKRHAASRKSPTKGPGRGDTVLLEDAWVQQLHAQVAQTTLPAGRLRRRDLLVVAAALASLNCSSPNGAFDPRSDGATDSSDGATDSTGGPATDADDTRGETDSGPGLGGSSGTGPGVDSGSETGTGAPADDTTGGPVCRPALATEVSPFGPGTLSGGGSFCNPTSWFRYESETMQGSWAGEAWHLQNVPPFCDGLENPCAPCNQASFNDTAGLGGFDLSGALQPQFDQCFFIEMGGAGVDADPPNDCGRETVAFWDLPQDDAPLLIAVRRDSSDLPPLADAFLAGWRPTLVLAQTCGCDGVNPMRFDCCVDTGVTTYDFDLGNGRDNVPVDGTGLVNLGDHTFEFFAAQGQSHPGCGDVGVDASWVLVRQ